MTNGIALTLYAALAVAGCTKKEGAPTQASEETTVETASAATDWRATGLIAGSLPEITDALASGSVTSETLVTTYVARIESVDWSGPGLQSVLALNPDALAEAKKSDARRKAGAALGPLDGAPILLKDNIESMDAMATTAGALALKDNITGRDSPLVAGLRAQGAIILGKTNLSQWANFRSNGSMSGWSALGGQAKNPHILDRNPCGSSSGSAVAVAASLAAGAVGTETFGSISCPATVNGIVGFKPTVGVISQRYIVPISPSQDTAGPMTKTVKGAAMLMNAMATDGAGVDYVAALDAEALVGKRIGVARFAQDSHPAAKRLFDAALKELEAAGAVLVEIEKFEPSAADFWSLAEKLLRFEFKASLNDYLAAAAPAVEARSLDALIEFNKAHADVELALFDQSIFEESAKLGGLDSAEYVAARDAVQKATRADGIDRLLAEFQIDAIVSPSGPLPPPVDPVNGDVWPEWAGAGWLAAAAGYPHLSVPMGAVHAAPVGLSFIGGKGADAAILSYGYAYEQRSGRRVEPRYLKTAAEQPAIDAAMRRKAQ